MARLPGVHALHRTRSRECPQRPDEAYQQGCRNAIRQRRGDAEGDSGEVEDVIPNRDAIHPNCGPLHCCGRWLRCSPRSNHRSNMCCEYFQEAVLGSSRAHRQRSLGIRWPVVGMILGLPLAMFARDGHAAETDGAIFEEAHFVFAGESWRRALVFPGIVGWQLASRGILSMSEDWAVRVPASKHVAFLGGVAHSSGQLPFRVCWGNRCDHPVGHSEV